MKYSKPPTAEAAQPITGRGIGYKLFTAGLIPSMARAEMQRVYRLLREAREQGMIPWSWIVDETRSLERRASWSDPEEYALCVARSYRRDFWDQQPARVEVWSEKGTVRGVLQPILDLYGVGFRVMHGFGSATAVYDTAQDDDGRRLIVLYVGDIDPSGVLMSEHDLPERLAKYDGGHVWLRRIALIWEQVGDLPSFPAAEKKNDPRYAWFERNYGSRCWELDAMDPATCAPASSMRSRARSSRRHGHAAAPSMRPNKNLCATCSMHGRGVVMKLSESAHSERGEILNGSHK
jgi:hypothetical protein